MGGGRIPTYERTTSLDSNLNLPRDSGAAQAGLEKAQGQAIQSIEGAEEALVKVRDVQQLNLANAFAVEQLSALKSQADVETDLQAYNKYSQQIDKVGEEAAKNIQGNVARGDFMARFKVAASSTRSSILDTFRKKQIDAAKADFLTNVDSLKNNYYDATYPADKIATAQLIKQSINDNINAQVISAAEGAKMWLTVSKELPIGEAERDIGRNPNLALQRLQNNSYGIQDPGKLGELVAHAQQAVLREQRMAQKGLEVAQEQKAHDYTLELWDGTLTLRKIEDGMRSGELRDADAKELRRAMLSDRTADLKKEDAVKQATTYMEMWDMILKKGKSEDKRRRILKEFADGNLKKDEAIKLYTGYIIPAQGGGKMSLAEQVASDQANSNRFKLLAGAIRLFNAFWNRMDQSDEGDTE